jgi:hypothetical protein
MCVAAYVPLADLLTCTRGSKIFDYTEPFILRPSHNSEPRVCRTATALVRMADTANSAAWEYPSVRPAFSAGVGRALVPGRSTSGTTPCLVTATILTTRIMLLFRPSPRVRPRIRTSSLDHNARDAPFLTTSHFPSLVRRRPAVHLRGHRGHRVPAR